MALLYFDDFTNLNAVADLITDSDIVLINDTTLETAHPFAGSCLLAGSAAQELRIPLAGFYTGTKVFTQFWCFFNYDNSSNRLNTVGTNFLVQSSGTSDNLYHVRLLINGAVLAVQAATGAYVARIPWPFVNGAWNYVETELTPSNTGSFVMRINGVEVCNITGTDFLHTTTTVNTLFINGHDDFMRIADVIVMDDTGSEFNGPLGEIRLETSLPSGDGATTAWTPTSGAHYTNIDDAVAAYDDDVTTISSGTANQTNLATHSATSAPNATAVVFAGVQVLARDDGASPDDIQPVARVGGTDYTGTTRTLATTYKRKPMFWEANPATAAAWSVSDVNSAEWGVKSIA